MVELGDAAERQRAIDGSPVEIDAREAPGWVEHERRRGGRDEERVDVEQARVAGVLVEASQVRRFWVSSTPRRTSIPGGGAISVTRLWSVKITKS